MKVNKTIVLPPAHHKWASSRTNFSEWVQDRIDEHRRNDGDYNPRIGNVPTMQLAAALYSRVQNEGWPDHNPEFTEWFKQLMFEAWGEEE